MFYGQARKLLSENIKLEKVITNTGKELARNDVDYGLSLQKCDVYIKVLKHDCPEPTRENNSLNTQETQSNTQQKNCKCKMHVDIWGGKKNNDNESWVYEYFSKYSKLVEDTPQYFMLKVIFYNITKTELYDNCDEILETLSEPCTDCLKNKWKEANIEKFKALRDTNQVKTR